jgi:hypothetical protein
MNASSPTMTDPAGTSSDQTSESLPENTTSAFPRPSWAPRVATGETRPPRMPNESIPRINTADLPRPRVPAPK